MFLQWGQRAFDRGLGIQGTLELWCFYRVLKDQRVQPLLLFQWEFLGLVLHLWCKSPPTHRQGHSSSTQISIFGQDQTTGSLGLTLELRIHHAFTRRGQTSFAWVTLCPKSKLMLVIHLLVDRIAWVEFESQSSYSPVSLWGDILTVATHAQTVICQL